MKKIFYTLIALAAIVGCQREEPFVESDEAQEQSGLEFTAQIETFVNETKTSLSGNSVVWSSGDQLAIFQGKDIADRYQVKDNCVGSGNGTFVFAEKGKGTPSVEYDANIAVYPYEADLRCTPNIVDGEVTSYTITGVTIPSKQIYVPDSFPEESFPMAAITDGLKDNNLHFKNLCGILELQLIGREKITSIVLSGRNKEPLSGDATITISNDGTPSLTMCAEADNGKNTYVYRTIMLDCGEGVQLNETVPTSFFITIPAGVFAAKGFILTITDYDGNTQKIEVANQKNGIERSCIRTMPKKEVATASSPSMICIINDNEVNVRAKSFDGLNDLVWSAKKEYNGYNHFFNLTKIQICPTTNADDTKLSGLSQWKTASDDICPIQVWGEHVGGNHGYKCVCKVTVPSHGLEDADIGSVWTDNKGYTYVLVFVDDTNTLGFVKFDDDSMKNGKMDCNTSVTSPMTRDSETNPRTIKITGQTKEQLRICSNGHSLKLYVDGEEKDLNIDAIIPCDRVEIIAEYKVIFVPAMLQYLMNNLGSNTKDSQHSEDIEDWYYSLVTRYQFNRNGSVSQYHTYKIYKTFDVGYGGLVQSGRFAENDPENTSYYIGNLPYVYTPDTKILDVLTCHDSSNNEYMMYKETWSDETKVPYRYYQFTDKNAEKGMCLAYDRSIGWGQPEERLKHIVGADSFAGRFRKDTKKMYPAFFCGGTLEKDLTFDGLGCRIPLYKYDEDLTAVGWYWVESGAMDFDASDDDIVLMIDSHKAVDKDIFLPAYMNGMQITVLDKTSNVECIQTQISDRKLRYNTNGSTKDYLVVRLSK
ncbi:MAG: hypothetical protein IKY95_03840 [Bacteroidales bacterium]|nr:hypothetical protein [Bacteroidales bacterium]